MANMISTDPNKLVASYKKALGDVSTPGSESAVLKAGTTPTLVTASANNSTNSGANSGTSSNPLNEILYSKKQYDSGVAAQNQGLKNWASSNAQQYYSQLDPNEAAMVKGMNSQQLSDYISGKSAGSQGAEVAQPTFTPGDYGVLDWNSALSQSRAQLDPLLQQTLAGIDQQAYQDKLDTGEIASAHGGAHSGLAADALNKVLIGAAGSKANAQAQSDAQAASMAQQLVQNSQARADNLRQQDWNEWLGQQNLGLSRDQLDWSKMVDTANLTGYLNGQQTLAGQEQNWNQNFQEQQFAYQQARDQIADKQWQQQFDEDVRRYGLDYALNRQVQLGQLSVQQGQLALSRSNSNADNSRQNTNANYSRLMDIWQMTGKAPAGLESYGIAAGTPLASGGGGGSSGGSSVSYSQAVDAIDSSPFITKDADGKMQITDSSGLENYIFSLNLPEADTQSLYQRYGLKWGG